jgi:hypothetical protein
MAENWLKRVYAKLIVPAGINPAYVSDKVANMIASTIIHEATHGSRWAKYFYTNQIPLNQMNRSVEERMAEDAERAAGLKFEIDPNDANLYGDSKNETAMTNEELLSRAVSIANSKTNFYIPADAVEEAPLSPEAQGMFQAVQDSVTRANTTPHIAWRAADRKLLIDVNKIVENYNSSLSGFGQRRPVILPSTFQEGEQNLTPGYTQQSPLSTARPGVPSSPAVPSRGSR